MTGEEDHKDQQDTDREESRALLQAEPSEAEEIKGFRSISLLVYSNHSAPLSQSLQLN